jgi:hypothetical protein
MARTLIYVAGPYSPLPSSTIDDNIAAAREVAIELWKRGFAVICPHLNTANFEVHAPQLTWEDYLHADEEILLRCDAVVFMPKWAQSTGATREREFAREHGIPCFDWPEAPPIHPTTVRSPEQCRAFQSTLQRMYRLHLDKNADYSPANILGTGELGAYVRLWDKAARLMNLAGFHLELSAPSKFEAPKTPKNESVEDTLVDLANYAIITRLLRLGCWGR